MTEENPILRTCTQHTDAKLSQVLTPFGGLGTGTVSLAGDGRLAEFQIRHRPDQDSIPGLSCLALRTRWEGGSDARLLEGPVRPPFHKHALRAGGSYHPGLGLGTAGLFGLPRCAHVSCRLGYPFMRVDLEDPACPVRIGLEAWNPLVPLDSVASSQPVLAMRVHVHNPTETLVHLDLAATLSNCFHQPSAGQPQHALHRQHDVSLLELRDPDLPADDPARGAIGWATTHAATSARACWPALPWMSAETRFWEQFLVTGSWEDDGLPGNPAKAVGSLYLHHSLDPGAHCVLPLWLLWRCPTASYRLGRSDAAGTARAGQVHTWPAPYAQRSRDLLDLAGQVAAADADRYAATTRFRAALEALDADAAVIDALGSTLTALRSPTTIALPEGDLWSYEGSRADEGSCPGSCGHVWAYDQALAWLWPDLARAWVDRSIRHLVAPSGASAFRIPIPPGDAPSAPRPAVEAQCNLIIRTCQLWRRWACAEWTRGHLPVLRRVLDWAERHWCNDRGLVEAVVHNTFDVEFTGRDARASILMQAARRAMACLEADLGEPTAAEHLRQRCAQAATAIDTELFDGWYLQRPDPDADAPRSGLSDDPLPVHQIGDGCLADQLLGAWLARCADLQTDLDPAYERAALQAILNRNWRAPLGEHVCAQRVYAMPDEAALLLVSWPRGGRPLVPMPYCDEAGWTGIEYMVAGHLLLLGETEAAERLVRGVRARFDGARRNPCNEYECGSYYGRSLAAWSLLLGTSAQAYDPNSGTLQLRAPEQREHGVLWAAAGAWGALRREDDGHLYFRVHGGRARLRSLMIAGRRHDLPRDLSVDQQVLLDA